MNLALSFNQAISLFPDCTATISGSNRQTYKEWGKRVYRVANLLMELGVHKGDVVAILCPNIAEFMEIYYGCAITGAVLNPINYRLSSGEMNQILQDSSATVLFAHCDFKAQVKEAHRDLDSLRTLVWIGDQQKAEFEPSGLMYELALGTVSEMPKKYPEINANDLAHLYYTSGTTGNAKGVMLTHANVCTHALAAIAELKLSNADTWIHVAPMFHLADAWATFAITWVGGRHVFIPYFETSEVLATIEREKVTITNLIPTMLNLMVNHQNVNNYDYSSLRYLLSGGAPIAQETVRKIVTTFGCEYVQTYGMTETSPYLTLSLLKEHLKKLPPDKQLEIKSRTGRAYMAVELKVVRANGEEVAKNDSEVGEIIVRGPTVTPGYWNQPEATAQAIKNGWLYTGDMATIDSEGYINIVDRVKDVIVSGGETIYSIQVEHALYEHPAVLECAVIGIPDDVWGEAVNATVVIKPNCSATEEELIAFVKNRIAHFKAPKSIDFIDALPRTGSGKIFKKALKDKYWDSRTKRIN